MKAVYLFAAIAILSLASAQNEHEACRSIQAALSPYQACHCFTAGLAAQLDPEDDQVKSAWIGCTRQDMPEIFNALNAFDNVTYVSKLWIWDSLLPVIPSSLFTYARPRVLVCESSDLRKFRDGAFDPLGERLRALELKNNIINDISEVQFKALSGLRRLDLSGNKLKRLSNRSFGALASLQVLALHKNKLEQIGDGTFSQMPQLRRLNLGHNGLSKISRSTFAGLEQLEHLNLEHNKIITIEEGAFEHMKNLKSLNLGGNLLTSIGLRALPVLEKLFLNNNAFYSLSNVRLTDLGALESLSLDKNHIQRIKNKDFDALPNLHTLSLASNQIVRIETNSFSKLGRLETLSLQNNALSTLPLKLFLPLKQLQHLFLSQNYLPAISERAFYGLSNLRVLGLAHNKISSVHRRAFGSLLSLERLYLNDNQLRSLQNTTLHYVESRLYAIDLSDNPWQCDCSLLWLARWLNKFAENVLNAHATYCTSPKSPVSLQSGRLAGRCDSSGPLVEPMPDTHSVWITVIGVVLGVVSVLILLAIALLYLQEGRLLLSGSNNQKQRELTVKAHDIRRVPSDMVTLIPRDPARPAEKRVRFEDGS